MNATDAAAAASPAAFPAVATAAPVDVGRLCAVDSGSVCSRAAACTDEPLSDRIRLLTALRGANGRRTGLVEGWGMNGGTDLCEGRALFAGVRDGCVATRVVGRDGMVVWGGRGWRLRVRV